MSRGYWRKGNPIRNGLFTDTNKPPASVFCAHLLDNPGTLSLLGGACTTTYLDLIKYTYKFLPPTCSSRLREPSHEAGVGRYSWPGTISWGHLGLIQDSIDAQRLGQVNIPVVLEDVMDTYAYGQHSTSSLRGRGGVIFNAPDEL